MHRAEHPLGRRGRRDCPGNDRATVDHQLPALPHPLRPQLVERVEREHVGLVSESERAEVVEVVVLGRVHRRQHECVLDRYAVLHGQPDAVVDVAASEDQIGFPVVAAQRDVRGPVAEHHRDQVGEVAARRPLPDEHPHPLAPLLLGFVELGALVVRLDPGREVGVELLAAQAGRMTVDAPGAGCVDLGHEVGIAGDHPGEVHDLGDADGAVIVEEPAHVGGAELRAGALERRRGHAARRAHTERERERGGGLCQRDDSGNTEYVRDLVRVGSHGGGAVGEHAADELVDPQLGRLQVHVRVDEPGGEGGTADVDGVDRVARTPPDHHAVADREVGVDPLTGGGHEDASSRDE